jgi:hypothetical protein
MSGQDPYYLRRLTDTGQLREADPETKQAFWPGEPADESGGRDVAAPELHAADDGPS